ncbi:Holliday junction resolvase RuvX [candidate division KSB3 bacterium]|uniref:Putative pre-16S rRNA nuclease n=1 Tax=candidate division KSB3 bacterium TaxID=2044937 RepID=A0A9D5JS58_9BACT|nr:Holliday junction resolvase RuvX [candidate division KSB3 bacterium]MBD3323198.1 Holliday junction resolvase RuvX [candidate division KSB3 bacterium]
MPGIFFINTALLLAEPDHTLQASRKSMGKILGLDVGEKTIGVAVSDELRWTAQGLTTLKRAGKTRDLSALTTLIDTHNVEEIVIGLPKNMNNTLGEQAEKVLKFSRLLETQFQDMKITLWDERLTTSAADRILLRADMSRKKRKKVINTLAAALILQNYLDATALESP